MEQENNPQKRNGRRLNEKSSKRHQIRIDYHSKIRGEKWDFAEI